LKGANFETLCLALSGHSPSTSWPHGPGHPHAAGVAGARRVLAASAARPQVALYGRLHFQLPVILIDSEAVTLPAARIFCLVEIQNPSAREVRRSLCCGYSWQHTQQANVAVAFLSSQLQFTNNPAHSKKLWAGATEYRILCLDDKKRSRSNPHYESIGGPASRRAGARRRDLICTSDAL